MTKEKDYTLRKKIIAACVGSTVLLLFSTVMVTNYVAFKCLQKAGLRQYNG